MTRANALVFLLAAVLFTADARAFDSRCRTDGGQACEDGPAAARTRWNAHDSEHMHIWDRIVSSMGLPEHLTAPVTLRVPTLDAMVEGVQTVQPHPFATTERLAERVYAIGEMTQLPDLSYSFWDWVLGNEYCPIGPWRSVRACHSFTTHMGTLNSSHFLPQAESFFRYYHKLAVERAGVCGHLRQNLDDEYISFVEQCDQHAFTYEAIAHHYLQDAWSMGHMWERWGGPNPSDLGSADWRERGMLAAITAGLIHGSKGVVQGLVDDTNWPKQTSLFSVGRPDVRDPLCAPLDPSDFMCEGIGISDDLRLDLRAVCSAGEFERTLDPPAYIDGHDGSKHRGIGDLYADEFATSGTYARPWARLTECAQASIAEVAGAAGIPVSAAGGSGPPPQESSYSGRCFGQRATNGSMWLGAGLDIIVEDVETEWLAPKLPRVGWIVLPGTRSTVWVRLPLAPIVSSKLVGYLREEVRDLFDIKSGAGDDLGAADAVIALAEQEGEVSLSEDMKTRYREQLGDFAQELKAWARTRPHGTAASTSLPPIVGVRDNSDGSYQHNPPADYLDPPLPHEPSFALETSITTDDDRADAVARAYHRAFAAEWCQVTTVDDLKTLKTDAEGPLCEVCGDLAGRHLRQGADAGNYDAEAPPLCEQLGGSEFIYLSGEPMEGETWVERGKSWCGCRDRCQAGIAGQVVDAESGEPVEGATVEYSADSAVDTMPTDADGNFESDFVACGDYHVRIEAGGYAPADLDVSIEEDGVVVQVVRLRAIAEECMGTMTSARGYVFDAVSNEPIEGAEVALRRGPVGPVNEPVQATAMTDATGLYLIENLEAGYYTLSATAEGYDEGGPREVSACSGEPEPDLHLMPEGEGLAFVLSWTQPDDLDLHLLLPDGDEVAFGPCAGSLSEAPFAHFEVDHLMADGPEALRVADLLPGVYTLYVHNFSAQNDGAAGFESSGAEVIVYENSQPVETYRVPTGGAGYFWDVLQLTGTRDNFELRTLGTLRNDRANPYADGDYEAVCTPARP